MSEVRNCFYRKTRDGGVDFTETVSRSKQSFKEECDVNNIMAKFKKTGVLPQVIRENPEYGDYSNPVDFQEGMNLVIKAQEQFAGLPAKLREKFQNDPKNFLEFCGKEENREEMGNLGLLNEAAMAALKNRKEAELDKALDARAAAKAKKADSVKNTGEKKD